MLYTDAQTAFASSFDPSRPFDPRLGINILLQANGGALFPVLELIPRRAY
jgi:hypothetical protein